MQIVYIHKITTPLGDMSAGVSASGVHLLTFINTDHAQKIKQALNPACKIVFSDEPKPVHIKLQEELNEYFEGKRKEFSVKAAITGTEFQQEVWRTVSIIPYGATRSYQQVSHKLENPKAVRAIARANGDNPVLILIPCHRIIGKNGKLTGYAGGLERKQKLLALEREFADNPQYKKGDQLRFL